MSYAGVARVRHGEEETKPVVAVSPEKGKLLQNERNKAIAVRQGSPENGDNKTALLSGAYKSKGKGKAVPLQAWSGPEGSRKLRFPDFMTTAQDGGMVVSLMHRPPLTPENTPGTHFC